MYGQNIRVALVSLSLAIAPFEAYADDEAGGKLTAEQSKILHEAKGDNPNISGYNGEKSEKITDAQNYGSITQVRVEGKYTAEASYNTFTVSGENYEPIQYGSAASIYGSHAIVTDVAKDGKGDEAITNNNKLYIKNLTTKEGLTLIGSIYAASSEMLKGENLSTLIDKVTVKDNLLDVSDSNINMRVVAAESNVNCQDDVVEVTGNNVVISKSTVLSQVFGAELSSYGDGNKGFGEITADNNIVQIDGSVVGSSTRINSIAGATVHCWKLNSAQKNIVTITNSQVYGRDGETDVAYIAGVSVDNAVEIKNTGNSKVEISGSYIDSNIYGSILGRPKGNNNCKDAADEGSTVKVANKSTVIGKVYGTYVTVADGTASAQSCSEPAVTVSDSTIKCSEGSTDSIWGAKVISYKGNAEASGHKVQVSSGSEIGGSIIGVEAGASKGNATGSGHITLLESSVGNNVTGSYLHGINVTDNGSTVAIENSKINGSWVYGSSLHGTRVVTKGSAVTITDNSEVSNVFGTWVKAKEDASAQSGSEPAVTVDHSTVKGTVRGVDLTSESGDAEASGSTVTITNESKVSGNIYGASLTSSAGNAEVSGSSVTIADKSEIAGEVYGAFVNSQAQSCKATALAEDSKPSVTVKNSTVKNKVYGAYVYSWYDTAQAIGQIVTVENSTIEDEVYGAYAKAYANGKAQTDGLKVTVKNSTITKSVYGGYLLKDYYGIAQADGHIVTVERSNIQGSVYGSYLLLSNGYAGYNFSVQADGHKVLVTDSTIAGILAGAQTEANLGSAAASNNTVSLKGGTYKDSIYGGRAIATGEKNTALSQNNTIILAQGTDGSSPVFDEDKSVVWGSEAVWNGKTDKSWTSGNTIQFDHVKGMTAANLKNVSTLDYQLPHMRAGEAVLTVKDGGHEKTDISDASVHVAVFSIEGRDGGEFREGERVILLQNQNEDSLIADGLKKESVTARQGISLTYDLLMETDDKSLYLTRKRMTLNPETKSVSEGWLAGLGLITQAADLVDDLSMRLNEEGWLPFAYVKGGSMRYNTGSHIDMNSLSLIAGIGRGVRTDSGLFVVGGFFEYGTGAYKTHNSFDSRSSIDGDGNTWYMGGGILASMDFKNTGPGHFYLEGSGHMGSLHNFYNNDDLRVDGRSASFETETPYYAVHGGLGYAWDIDEKNTLDVYGKYFWSMAEGSEDTLTTGDRYTFDNATSSRTRLGARYSCKVNEQFSSYIGAAWEHEFAGDSDSAAYGHEVSSPTLRGDSARGELGIELVPSKDLPLTVNFGVQGWLGKKEGVTGSCLFQYAF